MPITVSDPKTGYFYQEGYAMSFLMDYKKVLVVGLLFLGARVWDQVRYEPYWIQKVYGIESTFPDSFSTPKGDFDATMVPVDLTRGQHGLLVIPRDNSDYPVYLHFRRNLYPLIVQGQSIDRSDFVRSQPVLVENGTLVSRGGDRVGWQKRILVVPGLGESGNLELAPRGKKERVLGVLTHGSAELVYDLAQRSNPAS